MIIDKTSISNALNMNVMEEANIIECRTTGYTVEPEPENFSIEEELTNDVAAARANYYSIMDAGNTVLEQAKQIAVQSESPKAFESFALLMKNLADVNSQLIGVHEQRKKILENKKDPQQQGNTTITNNAVFVGTMSDLAKKLKQE